MKEPTIDRLLNAGFNNRKLSDNYILYKHLTDDNFIYVIPDKREIGICKEDYDILDGMDPKLNYYTEERLQQLYGLLTGKKLEFECTLEGAALYWKESEDSWALHTNHRNNKNEKLFNYNDMIEFAEEYHKFELEMIKLNNDTP